MTRIEKGVCLLSRIRKMTEQSFNERDMTQFLRWSFRYIYVQSIVFPGSKITGPGDVLNDVIEKQVFESRF